MKTILILFISLLVSVNSFSQGDFLSGELNIPQGWSHKVYLSIKANYRDIDIVRTSDIIATTVADSTGHFYFPKSIFTSKDQIFQIHLSEHEDEIELFLADFRKGMLGRNFLVLTQNNKNSTRILRSNKGRLFGSISSKNNEAPVWQKLDKAQIEFSRNAYSQGEEAQDYFFANYHDKLVRIVEGKSLLSQFLACRYLLIEDANLSNAYLESIEKHLEFLEKLKETSENKYGEHWVQLTKELSFIKLQLNDQKVEDGNESTIQALSGVIILLLAIMSVLIFLLIRLRNRAKLDITAGLTQREEKIKILIQQGLSNKEIAEKLFISLSTVKTHINSLYKKEGVSSRKELIEK